MGADSITVDCGQCHGLLDESPHLLMEDRHHCPRCGAMGRHFNLSVSGTVHLYSRVNAKGRRAGLKRPFVEQTVGDDLHRETGRWMKLDRLIDRLRNWYREVVTDPQTGDVILKCEEPLTDHQGHGSAKDAPNPGGADA